MQEDNFKSAKSKETIFIMRQLSFVMQVKK